MDGLIEFLGDAGGSVTYLQDDDHFAFLLPELAAAVAEAYPVPTHLHER